MLPLVVVVTNTIPDVATICGRLMLVRSPPKVTVYCRPPGT